MTPSKQHLEPTVEKSPRSPRHVRRDRFLLISSVVVLVGVCGYLGWYWKNSNSPGTHYYEKGMEYLAAKHYDLAEDAWVTGVRKDPRAWQCYEQLGALYIQAKKPSQAAYAYEEATKIVPDNGDLFIGLERAHTEEGDLSRAYVAAKQAAALEPANVVAVGDYGLLASQTQHDMEGITALRRALELNPTSAQYRMALVSLEIAELDLVRAENDLTPYLSAHPDDWQAQYYMAVILNQKPRTPDNLRLGLMHAEKALPGMIHNPQIYNLLGLLFLASGRTQAAYRAFLEGYKISPHSKEMLHGLLDCDNRQGDTREAALVASYLDKEAANENQIEQLKHMLGFNHKDTGAALELAHLYEVTGKRQQAFNLFVQALHETPDDPRLRPAFSALLQRSGESAMAKQILKPDFNP